MPILKKQVTKWVRTEDNKKTMHLRSCQLMLDGRYHSKVRTSMIPHEVHVAEADSDMILFSQLRHGLVKEAVGNRAKNNIKRHLVFSYNQFLGYSKKRSRVGRGLRTIFWLSDSGWSHAGGTFGPDALFDRCTEMSKSTHF